MKVLKIKVPKLYELWLSLFCQVACSIYPQLLPQHLSNWTHCSKQKDLLYSDVCALCWAAFVGKTEYRGTPDERPSWWETSLVWLLLGETCPIIRDRNLHGSGLSHTTTASPKPTLEGGWCHGWQRKCWMDNIKEWTSLPMPEVFTMASCGKHWKRIFAESSVMSPWQPSQSRDWNELSLHIAV